MKTRTRRPCAGRRSCHGTPVVLEREQAPEREAMVALARLVLGEPRRRPRRVADALRPAAKAMVVPRAQPLRERDAEALLASREHLVGHHAAERRLEEHLGLAVAILVLVRD